MDISNRTAFIAGATSGIGLELARCLSEDLRDPADDLELEI